MTPRNRTFQQGCANPHHERRVATRSAHTLEAVLRAFRTRRPPKVTLRGCKTSVSCGTSSKSHASSLQNVSYETSSKSHTSSLQNECFVRDFLQSHVSESSLQNEHFVRDFLQKSSGNTHRSTHITQPRQAVSRHEMSPASHLATSRFPAPATKIALPHFKIRTKYCACHEK